MYGTVVRVAGGLAILGGLGLAALPVTWTASFSEPAGFWFWLLTLFASVFLSGWIIGHGAGLVFGRRRYTTYGIYFSVAGGLGAGLWFAGGHFV